MAHSPQMPQVHKMPSPAALVRSSLRIYAVMGFVGFEIMWWFHKVTAQAFPFSHHDWWRDARLTLVSIFFLVLGNHCLEEFFPSYRGLKALFSEMFKGLSRLQIFLIAAASAVGEEILFRGAIQPYLGVWFTSLLFALFHVDPEGKTWTWTFWAFIGGLVMGGVTNVTESLWAAIFIHFGVNLISISKIVRLQTATATLGGSLEANDSETSISNIHDADK